MKSIHTHSLTLLISLCALSLTSCGFWKNEDALVPRTLPEVPAVADNHGNSPLPILPVTRTWEFTVNPKLTRGVIDLAMDPKGAVLGNRTARDTASLKGKIIVSITDDPVTGKRKMAIKDIRLTNTEAYQMDFAWGALVGSMTVDIPAGVLRILPNNIDRVCTLEGNKPFSLTQCYFTVLGHSHTRGHGLILRKAVGNRKVDLTMKKTEPVALKGTILMKNDVATLHIPRAVLRDQFDLEGTKLGLVFTAAITATAEAP